MNQTQNSTNSFNNNYNFFNNQNPNSNYLQSNYVIGQQPVKNNYYDSVLNSIITNQIKKVQDPLRAVEIATLFQIIYPTLKKEALSSYFFTRSLVPSTDSKQVLFKKYSLFYQSYQRTCSSFIRQYLPYISSQFRSEFNKCSLVKSIANNTYWMALFGFVIYGSKRMNYKWRNLTISPRFGWHAILFLILYSSFGQQVYQRMFKSLIKKNISEFDSLVKTQNLILMEEMTKQFVTQGQLKSSMDSTPTTSINEGYANYQTIQPESTKTVF